jgi:hypothetical protein
MRTSSIGTLCASLCALLAITVGAAPASASAPASEFNRAIPNHRFAYVNTVDRQPVPIRDAIGNQIVGPTGPVTAVQVPFSGCKPSPCARSTGFESTTSPIGELFYLWGSYPHDSRSVSGFVKASDLTAAPQMDVAGAMGNGVPAPPAPGAPQYTVTPTAIPGDQFYVGGDGVARQFTPYGLPVGSTNITQLGWNWIDVRGGGIARATVPGGATFYPSDVAPITTRSYDISGTIANGSVTAQYGRINNGAKDIYGWLATKHTTASGECYDHVSRARGPAPSGEISCPEVFRLNDVVADFVQVVKDGLGIGSR